MSDAGWESWIDTETIPNEGPPWLWWSLGVVLFLIVAIAVIGASLS